MHQGIRVARVALLMVMGVLLGVGTIAAQADALKLLVGTWKGELRMPFKKADAPVVLVVSSVKQEDGKWVADGGLGASEAKTAPVKISVDTSSARPNLRFTGPAGFAYSLDLIDDRTLVGKATVTGSSTVGNDRAVKLEKQ